MLVSTLKKKSHLDEICNELKITNREKEIIELIIEGKEHKEISNELKISINTVRNHIQNIYEKCQVQNKVEMIKKMTGI